MTAARFDLHRNRFTCCIRLENERTDVTEWALEVLARFVKELRATDKVAVEITRIHGYRSTLWRAASGAW